MSEHRYTGAGPRKERFRRSEIHRPTPNSASASSDLSLATITRLRE